MKLPSSVNSALLTLDPEQQKSFKREYNARAKSTLITFATWLIFGWHYLYLGRVGMQFAFWFTGGFLVVGWIIDFSRIPGMVSRYNADCARELMAQYRMITG